MTDHQPSRLSIWLRVGSFTAGYVLLATALIVPAGLCFMLLPIVWFHGLDWGQLMRRILLEWTLPIGVAGIAMVGISVVRRPKGPRASQEAHRSAARR